MFEVGRSGIDEMTIKLTWTRFFCEEVIEVTVPLAIGATFLFVTWTGVHYLYYSQKAFQTMTRCMHLIVCIICIGIASVPFLQLSQGLSQSDSWMMQPTRAFIKPWMMLQPFYVSNGYGLFRRMTGVGDATFMMNTRRNEGMEWGWAGLPPSVVARPEIILEAQVSKGSDKSMMLSRELHFRWKPGDVTQRPRQVAPYQPRLDWQMWFAALGSYQHNPWLIHLIYKLLRGCKPVIDLIDEPFLAPVYSANGVEEKDDEIVHSIRALLFHYDFTRANTSWNQRIPGTDILTNNERSDNNDWWTRTFVKEYLPNLDADNDSVKAFLRSQGFPIGKSFTCLSYEEKCSILQSEDKDFLSMVLRHLCSSLSAMRRLLRV